MMMMMLAGQQQHQQVQGGEASSSQHQHLGGTGLPQQEQQQENLEEPDHSSSNWYFSREYIEKGSPSRQDGIDLKKEAYFRKSYCTFLQDLGMRLKVPQVTIATAIVFCHRFFLRQSHVKNDRYMIATTCMFLAGKVEETPQKLCDVIYLSYEIRNKKDPAAIQKIKQKEVYEPQKELVLLGERLVLTTLGFDLNVHHPYKPLVAAIKKFKVAQNALAQVAWNFVNDGLRTSLCLQFKPHHIAAGAIFLAAKFLKVKLPNEGEKVWWQEFDVTPRQLEEVSNQMLELYEQNRDVSASRSSGPSASAGARNHNRNGDAVPSSSAAHAPEQGSTGDAEVKTIMSEYKEPTGEARPLCSRGENHNSLETGVKLVAESKVILGTIKPQMFEDVLPQPSEKSSLGEEAMVTDRQDAQAVADIHNVREEVDTPSQVIEENSIEKPRDLNSTTSVDQVPSDMRKTIMDKDQQMGHSPQQDLQLKKSWIGLDEVNIDRVKAALKRRKSRGEGGEARLLTNKTELTDEEELLERDLENRQKDVPYEENACRLMHTVVSQDHSVNDGTQSCCRSAIDDEEELLDRDFGNDFPFKKKDSNVHPPSLELDMSRGLQKDKECQERELKKPRIDI